MSQLVASELSCIKQDRVLFDNLSVTLSAGQLVHLRGPNGAGKTSLLRILAGLSAADSGHISWQNQSLGSDYFTQLVYLGHKNGLNLTLNAIENLYYWCAQHGVKISSAQLYDRLAALELTGLETLPVKALSAGQQRKVALARLWLKPAMVWLLDEPFTALDIRTIGMLENALNNFVTQGGAVMLTSHHVMTSAVGKVQSLDLEYRW
ncbi:cytochrome c biogenesis heme-transporting ATPase CcmA [Salinimonas sediminis]|uniref:Cytochrome c biogenesis heme-transporting ATPase CcmA n=1 Tax=Salinimonas sediminis TaxID=2303538 RepID=A0A346NJC2_9ALTE|nr:cytochrome c biogenesis heme-transporting ATPase CcmA [Salinimonas sediminis]AXR05629.1 cytochrome c biogenesis heme-transporting ATPase CcmA [Salinimonas sediminis]